MKKTLIVSLAALCLFACKPKQTQEETPAESVHALADTHATPETVALFARMTALLDKGILLGHQDDMAYGHGWYNEPGRSDVKDVTGRYPGVMGWEIGHVELGAEYNLDSIYFENMKRYIREAHQLGAINTVSWHGDNIVTGGSAWDCAQDTVVKSILPGGSNHDKFLGWLDKVSGFFLDLKDDSGTLIPVIFRPYHEHTGAWFWWGSRQCTAEEYKQLWTMTVDYLRDTRGVHHLLYAYSPSSVPNETEYLSRYPGDDCVDIVGFDCYANGEGDERTPEKVAEQLKRYMHVMTTSLDIVTAYAQKSGKIPTISETGMEGFPDSTFFSNTIYNTIKDYKVSYVLFWRNAHDRPSHYYLPFPGSNNMDDFRKLVAEPGILMTNYEL